MNYTESELHDMSDEELEAAVKKAKGELGEIEKEQAMLDSLPADEVEDQEEAVMEEPEEAELEEPEATEESNDNETDEPEEEETSEEEVSPAPEDESEEDGTEDDNEDSDEVAVQTFKPLKVDGKEVPINSLDELYTLASAGGQFTRKMQEIAPYRKAVAAMAENGLSDKDISLFIEATKGNKDALASIISKSGVDPLDINEKPDASYEPGAYLPSDSSLQLKEVQQAIMNDPEYSITEDIVNNQMDVASQNMLIQNPEMIKGIHQDVQSGVYPAVSAEAAKLKLMDGGRKSDMDYYIEAAKSGAYQNYAQEAPVETPEPVQTRPAVNPALNAQRKAASSTRARKTPAPKVVDYLEMSDEDIAKKREEIMSKY